MKKQALYLIIATAALFASCSSNNDDPGNGGGTTNSNVVEVSGDIKTNTTWSADKIYLLKGFVYVTDGATLTIAPGTIVKGDKVTKGSLIITRTSKISAIGTASQPIVFTSNQPAGSRNTGDWGGLIILGRAPVNQTGGEVVIEGGLTPTGGGSAAKYTTYGGTDPADNSGTLKYVRFEYGGVPFAPDNEINGLTLGGVGNGTTIDYVEVYRAGDDSIEWFGGTVNAKHLISVGALDDDFDTDFGFSGNIQFALAQRYPTIADVSGSNGFESDNDGNGSNFTPVTAPVFSNVTIIGPRWESTINANYQHAAQIRRSSSLSTYNSIFVDCVEGVYIDDSKIVTGGVKTSDRLLGTTPTLFFKNNLIYNCNSKSTQIKAGDATTLAAVTAKFATDGNVVDATIKGADIMVDPNKLSSDFKFAGTPNWLLKSGVAALTGASFTDAKVSGSFFEKVAFKGAFGTDNWAAGWAHFDPQSLPYTTPGAVK